MTLKTQRTFQHITNETLQGNNPHKRISRRLPPGLLERKPDVNSILSPLKWLLPLPANTPTIK